MKLMLYSLLTLLSINTVAFAAGRALTTKEQAEYQAKVSQDLDKILAEKKYKYCIDIPGSCTEQEKNEYFRTFQSTSKSRNEEEDASRRLDRIIEEQKNRDGAR